MSKYSLVLLLLISFKSFSQATDCSEILTSKIDKITGEQSKMTKQLPFKAAYALVESPVTYLQTIKGGDTTLYMSLQSYGSTLNVDGKGVIILLTRLKYTTT